MSELQFIAPTARWKMTRARACKIFLNRNGRCYVCTNQIRDGEQWTVEHPSPLALGGSDDDADLWPVHIQHGRDKTKDDVRAIRKRDRLITASWVGKPRSKLSKAYRREQLRWRQEQEAKHER